MKPILPVLKIIKSDLFDELTLFVPTKKYDETIKALEEQMKERNIE